MSLTVSVSKPETPLQLNVADSPTYWQTVIPRLLQATEPVSPRRTRLNRGWTTIKRHRILTLLPRATHPAG